MYKGLFDAGELRTGSFMRSSNSDIMATGCFAETLLRMPSNPWAGETYGGWRLFCPRFMREKSIGVHDWEKSISVHDFSSL